MADRSPTGEAASSGRSNASTGSRGPVRPVQEDVRARWRRRCRRTSSSPPGTPPARCRPGRARRRSRPGPAAGWCPPGWRWRSTWRSARRTGSPARARTARWGWPARRERAHVQAGPPAAGRARRRRTASAAHRQRRGRVPVVVGEVGGDGQQVDRGGQLARRPGRQERAEVRRLHHARAAAGHHQPVGPRQLPAQHRRHPVRRRCRAAPRARPSPPPPTAARARPARSGWRRPARCPRRGRAAAGRAPPGRRAARRRGRGSARRPGCRTSRRTRRRRSRRPGRRGCRGGPAGSGRAARRRAAPRSRRAGPGRRRPPGRRTGSPRRGCRPRRWRSGREPGRGRGGAPARSSRRGCRRPGAGRTRRGSRSRRDVVSCGAMTSAGGGVGTPPSCPRPATPRGGRGTDDRSPATEAAGLLRNRVLGRLRTNSCSGKYLRAAWAAGPTGGPLWIIRPRGSPVRPQGRYGRPGSRQDRRSGRDETSTSAVCTTRAVCEAG